MPTMTHLSIWVSALATSAGISGVLLCVAHLLPWASHATATLTLTGNDLAFFTHFTPGAGVFRNEWFYFPVWIGAVQLARATLYRDTLGRTCGIIGSCAIAALALPRYQFLIGLRDAIRLHGLSAIPQFEFGLQLGVTLGLMLILAVILVGANTKFAKVLTQQWLSSRFASACPNARLAFLLDFLCLVGCLVPLLGLLSIQNAIETLYQSKIALGIGWWLHFIAIFRLTLSGSAKIKGAFLS